jgi:hypothetical protein
MMCTLHDAQESAAPHTGSQGGGSHSPVLRTRLHMFYVRPTIFLTLAWYGGR